MNDEALLKLILAYLNAKKANKNKLPYKLNIFDELHANENAHTRILVKLLEFEQRRKKPFLEGFIKLINDELYNGNHGSKKFHIKNKENFKIYEQFPYIDCYIDCYILSDNYAIIIENKINGASDQWKQIQRYIEATKKRQYSDDKIYVIYLTNNGSKKVSNNSFTAEAKKHLDYTDTNNGRFVPMNYRNHILPLLEDFLNDYSFNSENNLKAALVQYVDYLKGRFCMCDEDEKYYEKICAKLKKSMPIKNLDNKALYEKVNEIEEELISFFDRIKKAPLMEKAAKIKEQYKKTECKPFTKPEVYNEDEFPIVVFSDFAFENFVYKLDVMVDLNGFLLTFKKDDNFNVENQTLMNYLKTNRFEECPLTRRINKYDFEELDEVLQNLFKDLQELNL